MSSKLSRGRSLDFPAFVKKWSLYAAAEALVIANSTLLIGLFLYQLVYPLELFIPFFQVDLDLSLIGVIFIWAAMILNPAGLILLVVGWIFAGIYVKRKYGDITSTTLLIASSIPVTIAIISVGMVLISLLLSGASAAFGILQVLLIFVVLYIFSAIFAIPGLIITQFVSFNNSYQYEIAVEKDYLVLDVLPVGEKTSPCPFRSDLPGCSYLGYRAPELPLICDFESTYLRCRVYSHIYSEYVGDTK